jgi:hypothetical protein
MQYQYPQNLTPQAVTLLDRDDRIATLMKSSPAHLALLNNLLIAARQNQDVVIVKGVKADGISFHVKNMKNGDTRHVKIDTNFEPVYNVGALEKGLGYEIPKEGLVMISTQKDIVAPVLVK